MEFTTSQAEKIWVKRLTVSHGSTVCVNGQVYGGSGRGDVRGWVAVDARTGALDQVADLKIGSSIYADERFYCLTEDGLMSLQQLLPSGFKTAGSFRLAKGKDVWAHPVICGGHLFLRYHDTLFCYQLRP